MKTTILLFTLVFLIGCQSSKPPAPAPKVHIQGSGDSADSPIIVSDNSSNLQGPNARVTAATSLTFYKENQLRVYGPKVLAAKVDDYSPTWLELVGVTQAASGCTSSTGTPSATSGTNCLAGATSWTIAINPSLATLNWNGANNEERVNISLGSPNPAFGTCASGASGCFGKAADKTTYLTASMPTTASISGATLTMILADGSSTQPITYSCNTNPCQIKVHYVCTEGSGCGN